MDQTNIPLQNVPFVSTSDRRLNNLVDIDPTRGRHLRPTFVADICGNCLVADP